MSEFVSDSVLDSIRIVRWPFANTAILMALGFIVMVLFLVVTVMYLTLIERRVLGFIQVRLGPNRVGPQGLLQPVADAIKLLLKEDIVNLNVDRFSFSLAPVVVFMPTILSFVVIPFGVAALNHTYSFIVVKDLNVGILYLMAVSSYTIIGILMAGWGSNNKWSLVGAMRSAAQIISYEVPMVLAVLGVVLAAGSTSLVGIVNAQYHIWFFIPQILGFLVYVVTCVGEVNRSPFDLPEAESELVAGFHTEYSGMRWALFFLAEYANLFIVSALVTLLFLGGWHGPALPGDVGMSLLWLTSIFWFLLKTYIMVFIFIWIRATLPRFRVDQMMSFAWKFLLPVALVNFFIVSLGVAYRHPWYDGSVMASIAAGGAYATRVARPNFWDVFKVYAQLTPDERAFYIVVALLTAVVFALLVSLFLRVKRGIKPSKELEKQWQL